MQHAFDARYCLACDVLIGKVAGDQLGRLDVRDCLSRTIQCGVDVFALAGAEVVDHTHVMAAP